MSLFQRLFDRKVRGFRVVEVVGALVLGATVLSVYFAKADAGSESAVIADVNHQIADEARKVRGLKADLASREAPQTLETLSTTVLRMQPIPATHEIDAAGLAQIAHRTQTTTRALVAPAVRVKGVGQ